MWDVRCTWWFGEKSWCKMHRNCWFEICAICEIKQIFDFTDCTDFKPKTFTHQLLWSTTVHQLSWCKDLCINFVNAQASFTYGNLMQRSPNRFVWADINFIYLFETFDLFDQLCFCCTMKDWSFTFGHDLVTSFFYIFDVQLITFGD